MSHLEKNSSITADILDKLPSPCWLLEEELLESNLKILKDIKEQTNIKILLALKGYALWHSFPLVNEYLDGCCASGLFEAKLSFEEFKKETHSYSPAFKDEDIEEITKISNHLVFNSPSQLKKFYKEAKSINSNISIGLRVNPQYSEAPVEAYNPCGIYSRLGTLASDIEEDVINSIDGFHFHALCEQDALALEGVLRVFEDKFGVYLPKLKWVNFGGGHHITRRGYDRKRLIDIINNFKSKYPHLKIYIELGEAIGWQTGVLIATVVDIVKNGMEIAILDISAEAHMPDTIIMPYKAEVRGGADAKEKEFTYRLTGNSCLAGDIMGDYSFDKPLKVGDKIIFEDQMHYTMVKATTFNGILLPTIATLHKDGNISIDRSFTYRDFKERLG